MEEKLAQGKRSGAKSGCRAVSKGLVLELGRADVSQDSGTGDGKKWKNWIHI